MFKNIWVLVINRNLQSSNCLPCVYILELKIVEGVKELSKISLELIRGLLFERRHVLFGCDHLDERVRRRLECSVPHVYYSVRETSFSDRETRTRHPFISSFPWEETIYSLYENSNPFILSKFMSIQTFYSEDLKKN